MFQTPLIFVLCGASVSSFLATAPLLRASPSESGSRILFHQMCILICRIGIMIRRFMHRSVGSLFANGKYTFDAKDRRQFVVRVTPLLWIGIRSDVSCDRFQSSSSDAAHVMPHL